jgi:hypothetical protein
MKSGGIHQGNDTEHYFMQFFFYAAQSIKKDVRF